MSTTSSQSQSISRTPSVTPSYVPVAAAAAEPVLSTSELAGVGVISAVILLAACVCIAVILARRIASRPKKKPPPEVVVVDCLTDTPSLQGPEPLAEVKDAASDAQPAAHLGRISKTSHLATASLSGVSRPHVVPALALAAPAAVGGATISPFFAAQTDSDSDSSDDEESSSSAMRSGASSEPGALELSHAASRPPTAQSSAVVNVGASATASVAGKNDTDAPVAVTALRDAVMVASVRQPALPRLGQVRSRINWLRVAMRLTEVRKTGLAASTGRPPTQVEIASARGPSLLRVDLAQNGAAAMRSVVPSLSARPALGAEPAKSTPVGGQDFGRGVVSPSESVIAPVLAPPSASFSAAFARAFATARRLAVDPSQDLAPSSGLSVGLGEAASRRPLARAKTMAPSETQGRWLGADAGRSGQDSRTAMAPMGRQPPLSARLAVVSVQPRPAEAPLGRLPAMQAKSAREPQAAWTPVRGPTSAASGVPRPGIEGDSSSMASLGRISADPSGVGRARVSLTSRVPGPPVVPPGAVGQEGSESDHWRDDSFDSRSFVAATQRSAPPTELLLRSQAARAALDASTPRAPVQEAWADPQPTVRGLGSIARAPESSPRAAAGTAVRVTARGAQPLLPPSMQVLHRGTGTDAGWAAPAPPLSPEAGGVRRDGRIGRRSVVGHAGDFLADDDVFPAEETSDALPTSAPRPSKYPPLQLDRGLSLGRVDRNTFRNVFGGGPATARPAAVTGSGVLASPATGRALTGRV